ncbi:MAG: phospho-N-acetylmuramoyl-pentapeptide-transferase [bacterium]|nr:phospho-N-acetylmuramoyl-pentapeptide-transferase [bacterium]
MVEFMPPRPEISLIAIVGYAFFAFLIGLAATPSFVRFLRKNRIGKQLRVESVDGRGASIFRKYHKDKYGTPTMGGILIWLSIVVTVLFSRSLSFYGAVDHSILQRGEVYLPLLTLVFLGLLGAIDDYINVSISNKKGGLNVFPKVIVLLLFSTIGSWWFISKLGISQIHVPFVGSYDLGFWYIPVFFFIVIGTANAVNVTDGLDGLAAGLLIIAYTSLAIVAFLSGYTVLASFCAVTAGAIAAFLWHNVPPALFFMGDTGSLALGGTLGVIALMTDNIIVLPFIGFVFVIEMLSVIIQLLSKKLRGGKKVFLAAPIHHHFEALDWGESKVTMRLWIIGSFFALIGIFIGIAG